MDAIFYKNVGGWFVKVWPLPKRERRQWTMQDIIATGFSPVLAREYIKKHKKDLTT
jgi:hypothetical protein